MSSILKPLVLAAAASLCLPAFAATGAAAASAPSQQTKMKTCNASAKGKHGDERKAFMKQCLSKKADAPAT